MKYLIIFKMIVLTSFPTYTKVMELTEETYSKDEAINFYNFMITQTSEVRIDSIFSTEPCNHTPMFEKFKKN